MTTLSKRDQALALAKMGFYVFPLAPNDKTPAIKEWPDRATLNPATIRKWWDENVDYNIGIFTGKFGKSGKDALIAIDVDVKNGKRGDESLAQLEAAHGKLPETMVSHTPTGGRHIILRHPEGVKSGTDVLGNGLDTLSVYCVFYLPLRASGSLALFHY